MERRDVVEAVTLRLSGELPPERAAALDDLLRSDADARAEADAVSAAWKKLGEDRDLTPSFDFRRATLAVMEEETLRRRVRPFTPRGTPARWIGQAAALLAAGFVGFTIARPVVTPVAPGEATPVPSGLARLALQSERKIDAASTLPDLSAKPRLSNVAYLPADANGKIGVVFDLTTRYTVVGRPEEKGIADVLSYLVSGGGSAQGSRGGAIEALSANYGGESPPAPEVVAVLVETLKKDRNPGVRKRAAEALAQLPATDQTRDAFAEALKSETNPAIRIVAIEGLAKAARALRDAETIASLRERAADETENGYVRVKAATALQRIGR